MSLQGFYKENVKREKKLHEVVISDAFKDENGEPEVWKLKALKQTKITNMFNKHIDIITNTKKGTSITKGDMSAYTLELMAETIVYPNLKDASLQNSYGVMSPEDLLDAMFEDDNDGFNKLLKEVNKVNGNLKDLDELTEEVKN